MGVIRVSTEKHVNLFDNVLAENISDFYISAFENHPDAVFVLDSRGYYCHWNKQTYQLLGYTETDYAGQKFGDFTPSLNREMAWEAFQRSLTGEAQEFEVSTQHRDGHEVYLHTTLVPVNINDQIWAMGFCKDVSDRVRMEQKLLHSQSSLERAQEIANIGNWSMDVETKIVHFTERARLMYGLLYCDVPLTHVMGRIHSDDRERVVESIHGAIGDLGLVHDLEYRIIHAHGVVRWVHVHGTMTIDTGGRPILFGSVQDTTDRKTTEEVLIKSEKLSVVGQLAAGMSHEIRNPLTVAKGIMQLFEETVPADSPKHMFYIDMVKEALNQIELLTGQMLVLASPQVDNRGEKNVVHLVQDVMNLFRAESLLHNVEMVFTTPIELIPIVCDEHQIKQVFVNIMKNAFEAMPTGGTLNIDVSLQERQILISFGDNGHGIETERIQHLGEPFYSTKEKGTGLGLLISQKILSGHDGTLQVTSEVGEGTTVTVSLPLTLEGAWV